MIVVQAVNKETGAPVNDTLIIGLTYADLFALMHSVVDQKMPDNCSIRHLLIASAPDDEKLQNLLRGSVRDALGKEPTIREATIGKDGKAIPEGG